MNIQKLILVALLLVIQLSCFSQAWQTNIDEAKAMAAVEGKVILLSFQGSDWCAPCRKLERDVFATEAFERYAAEHLVLVRVDFPRRKKNALDTTQIAHNQQLAEKYNPQGVFPMVVLLDEADQVLGRTGYKKMDAEAYVDHLTSLLN